MEINGVNALYILLRTVISFCLHYINTFVLSKLFHYPERFLHHLVGKNEGRMYLEISALLGGEKILLCSVFTPHLNSESKHDQMLGTEFNMLQSSVMVIQQSQPYFFVE